ncbi:Heterogeneous nuclear ribonucleoprotein A1-like protein 2 [Cricetulus griseus]|uniref:Heterogeneous nuclear ribonucleoprotein A1 n=1 Tax=Cricetulus griseus TaxID=10029 RepID=G3HPA6_CRIGR|nr:Heterogeneous nuclear ribonucleoprotein A1-like protein 2 [Cricetulus griseus]ERE65566.1 heterogeneous nuclear ribonucleoprotein A1 [Cricetulus griseus]
MTDKDGRQKRASAFVNVDEHDSEVKIVFQKYHQVSCHYLEVREAMQKQGMASASSSLRGWNGSGKSGIGHEVSLSDSVVVALEAAEVGVAVIKFCGYNGFGNGGYGEGGPVYSEGTRGYNSSGQSYTNQNSGCADSCEISETYKPRKYREF